MARPLRIPVEGGVYHVTSRGTERREIVRDHWDCVKWLDLFGRVATRRSWRVFAWVLMPNHYHFFLRTPEADLSEGMHDLNSGYATVHNRRHRRCGPLFQGRFKAVLVEHESHYWELTRYLHLNPVRAGLVDRPEVYEWSSCRAYFDSRLAPPWLAWEEALLQHGDNIRDARSGYMRFLIEGLSFGASSPMDAAEASLILGSERFVADTRATLDDEKRSRFDERLYEPPPEPTPEAVLGDVAETFGVAADDLLLPRKRSEARSVAISLIRGYTSATLTRIGEYFGVSKAAISNTVARVGKRRREDERLDQKCLEIEAKLGVRRTHYT